MTQKRKNIDGEMIDTNANEMLHDEIRHDLAVLEVDSKSGSDYNIRRTRPC